MALRSPIGNDIIYELLSHADETELPRSLNFLHFMKHPIRYQHGRGTCAAIAAAVIREVQYYRQNGKAPPQLSPEFIYYHRDTKPLPGMHGRNVFEILAELGIPPEEHMPYRDGEGGRGPSRKAYRRARRYRITSYARIETPDGLKRALFNVGPCFIVLPKYHDGKQFWRRARHSTLRDSGVIGHAVVVIGYNKRGFLLVNSWGPEWNGDGITLLPYGHWSDVWETWVSHTEPEEPKKGIVKRLLKGGSLKRVFSVK